MKKIKIDYRHIICILITLGFLCCSAFIFRSAFMRFWDSLKSFGLSVGYYFSALFKIDNNIHITVNDLPKTNILFIPDNSMDFKVKLGLYWQALISKDNFNNYSNVFGSILFSATQIILLVGVPLVLIFYILLRRYFKVENNDYNKDSKPLKILKKFENKIYLPIKIWLVSFVKFIKNHSLYIKLWLFIWVFNFNLLAIVLSFFAYYFYFVVSFDFASIYIQVYKLFTDLSPAFNFIPWWIWVILVLILLDKWRKKVAYRRLNHMEMKNRGFINERPIVSMACGPMGCKKTTIVTDMLLSQEVMFRDKAFEKILENDLKFANFPWINLENEIKKHMEKHKVFNLATCKVFIENKQKAFLKKKTSDYNVKKSMLFDYDYKKYDYFYNDNLKVVDIWEVLSIYTQLYFIYVVQSSLIISNYSIRTDNVLRDMGNFPKWDSNFFKRDSRLIDSFSRHSKILDFDTLRLGKKIIKDNAKKDMFEFGVLGVTEIGKERLNNLETQEIKKKDDNANQKNDLFNQRLKMIRHNATIDNFCFVKFICDEQRPESWGADARDLCDIMRIQKGGEKKLAMPLFFFGELLYDLIFSKFSDFYYQYRFNRADNTLFLHIFKWITSKIYNYYTRIYNNFSYTNINIFVENGIMDGKFDERVYYLMSKKIYSKRFSTDCYNDYFFMKTILSKWGIADLYEFGTEKATDEEMKQMNSYFYIAMLNADKE